MRRLFTCTSGTAAAEMALVAPLLIGLMFGSMELGFYFYSEHVVVKAVRDGARFASREGFDKYDCSDSSSGTVDSSAKQDIQRVTRTDQVASGGSPRIAEWTDDASVDVKVTCDISGSYGSFYQGLSDSSNNPVVPVVTVTATVAYTPLFDRLGFNATNLHLTAKSEAPVMGL
jgi:Flp pilus assembly protein TadG